MTELKYHKALRITERKPEWAPYLPFEFKLEFELENLDISLVNGLRRTLLAEVPCLSIGPDVSLEVDQNVTVFNSQYLKNRFSQQPIHLNSLDELNKYSKIVFRLSDPDDLDKPLINNDNFDKNITMRDLIILEEIPDGEVVAETTASVETKETAEEIDEDEDEDIEDKTPEEVKMENAVEGEEEAIASAEAGEDLLAGEIAGTAPEGMGSHPGAEEGPPTKLVPQGTRYRRSELTPQDFFTYVDMYILTIKKGESIFAQMKPQSGIGKQHARWGSGLVRYNFKSRNSEMLKNPDNWGSPNYHPIRDRQNYAPSELIAGQYGTPQTFEMSVEYNGHYRPARVWLASISALKQKLENFREQVRLITGENGKVTPNLSVQFSSADNVPYLVTLTLTNEDHTLGNIIFSHYLYHLQEMITNITGEKYSSELLQSFSHYRVPHPLDNKLIIMLKVPEWSQEKISKGLQTLLRAGDNPYDDIFYQNTPTLRLLMIVLEHIIGELIQIEIEGKRVLEKVEADEVQYLPIPERLPQAAIVETPKEAEIQEFDADILLEQEEMVGEKEEAAEELGGPL